MQINVVIVVDRFRGKLKAMQLKLLLKTLVIQKKNNLFRDDEKTPEKTFQFRFGRKKGGEMCQKCARTCRRTLRYVMLNIVLQQLCLLRLLYY